MLNPVNCWLLTTNPLSNGILSPILIQKRYHHLLESFHKASIAPFNLFTYSS